MDIITPVGDKNKYFSFVERQKQLKIKRRVLAYITKVASNSREGYCCVAQEVIRKALKVRKKTIADAIGALVEEGKLLRFAAENKNRKNPKYYYLLPNTELLGNSNKSLFISPLLKETTEIKREVENENVSFVGVDNWGGLERLELIEAYIDSGLMVTPLVELEKIPLSGWSKDFLRRQPKSELLKFFAENPKSNVGCWLPENLIAVDIDDADKFYELTSGEVFDTLTSTSGRGFHNWFLNGARVGNANGVRPSLDFKGSGCLMVLPPSIHKSGRSYEWTNLVQPIDAPQLIKDLYDTRESLKSYAAETPRGIRKSSPFITKESVIERGQRYNQLFRLGRHLRHSLPVEKLVAELYGYNAACCKPSLDERRMRKVIWDVRFGPEKVTKTNSTLVHD